MITGDYLTASIILFSMYLYLQLLLVFVIIPNIILLYINRKKIHVQSLLIALLVLFVIALVWDQLSVRWGVWTFSENEIIGNVFGLPLEEYLFFFFVPLLCINIYILIVGFFNRTKKN